MTTDEATRIEVYDAVRDGWRTGVVTQSAPRWFMVNWTDSDIPTIVRRDNCARLRKIAS